VVKLAARATVQTIMTQVEKPGITSAAGYESRETPGSGIEAHVLHADDLLTFMHGDGVYQMVRSSVGKCS